MTEFTLIAACDEQNGIGFKGRLPWNLPKDLAFFKQQTLGKCILMGRKTFDSIGRPLPGRRNIVLTRQQIEIPGVETVDDLKKVSQLTNGEVMVIGGQQIYELALPYAKNIILTKVHGTFEVDTYFPAISKDLFVCVKQEHHLADETNPFDMTFQFFKRK